MIIRGKPPLAMRAIETNSNLKCFDQFQKNRHQQPDCDNGRRDDNKRNADRNGDLPDNGPLHRLSRKLLKNGCRIMPANA
jgi:hypothetical protein